MKKIYRNVNLDCTFQNSPALHAEHSTALEEGQCLNGVISKTSDGFRFEEAVKCRPNKRNPKLFDGRYCSLVHMQNGRYQIHMKTINASSVADPVELAFLVYNELIHAFQIID